MEGDGGPALKGEREAVDPNEESFLGLLSQGIRELRNRRGPCPSSETLVAFYGKRLAEAEAARVREHIEACGLCDVQLGRLEEADEPRWRSIAEAFWTVLRHPALAYALVALLLWPAYRGFVPRAASPELRIGPVPSFSLDVVRSESQPQKSLVLLTTDEKFFLLSFFVPLQTSPPQSYEVSVVRSDNAAVAPAQALRNCDTVGNCFVLCNAALFEPGRYELRVQQAASESRGVVHRFPFEVRR
jgi:hypothetical protein